jgi:hypothetical protein
MPKGYLGLLGFTSLVIPDIYLQLKPITTIGSLVGGGKTSEFVLKI